MVKKSNQRVNGFYTDEEGRVRPITDYKRKRTKIPRKELEKKLEKILTSDNKNLHSLVHNALNQGPERIKTIEVKSLTDSNKVYQVSGAFSKEEAFENGDLYNCTCPYFEHRLKGTGQTCKHIEVVKDELDSWRDNLQLEIDIQEQKRKEEEVRKEILEREREGLERVYNTRMQKLEEDYKNKTEQQRVLPERVLKFLQDNLNEDKLLEFDILINTDPQKKKREIIKKKMELIFYLSKQKSLLEKSQMAGKEKVTQNIEEKLDKMAKEIITINNLKV